MENTDMNDKKSAPAMDTSEILIMTELAEIGLASLKQSMPQIEKIVSEGKDTNITKENLAHLQSLVAVGDGVCDRFHRISQYIYDQSVAAAKDAEKKAEQKD